MRNRTPVPRAERPPVPDFTPVPRKFRHDGWTPERQKAFIEALADTGSVSRAARQVNIAQTNAYALRRAPGAEEFRRAWDAALDFGVLRLKDVAFERALEGQLTPVFKDGKLMGFQRKWNDALLMFCLRHYGQDGEGRRTTVNYFSTRASAGAQAETSRGRPSTSLRTSGEGETGQAAAVAEAAITTVRTIITGGGRGDRAQGGDAAAAVVNGFAGVDLDPQAQAEIAAALEACAARARAGDSWHNPESGGAIEHRLDDPGTHYAPLAPSDSPYQGALESGDWAEDHVPIHPGEAGWKLAGLALPDWDQGTEPGPADAAADPAAR